jgi:hypothetical protein
MRAERSMGSSRPLRDAGVTRVVDVCELPLLRRRGFSKSRLAETLERFAIRYEHVRALGNPEAFRDLYKDTKTARSIAVHKPTAHTYTTDPIPLSSSWPTVSLTNQPACSASKDPITSATAP